MGMNWENGLYICAKCQDEFSNDELTQIYGGVETDEHGRETQYGINVCPDCYKKYVDEIAARLLT